MILFTRLNMKRVYVLLFMNKLKKEKKEKTVEMFSGTNHTHKAFYSLYLIIRKNWRENIRGKKD